MLASDTPCFAAALQQQIQQISNWQPFLTQLHWHRIASLVWPKIQPLKKHFPSHIIEAVSAEHQKCVKSALKHVALLRIIENLFNQHAIRYLSIKGPVLSQQLYGHFAARFSRDLDIIVAEADVEPAIALLCANGFCCESFDVATPCKRFAQFYLQKDTTLTHPHLGATLELHWRWDINPSIFQLDFESAWKHKTWVTIADMQIPTLEPALNLLYLCMHGSKSFWARLSWLTDIDRIASQDLVDWKQVAHFAKITNSERVLNYGVLLSHRLLNTPIPVFFAPADIEKPALRALCRIGQWSNARGDYPGPLLNRLLVLPLATGWHYYLNWYTRFSGVHPKDIEAVNLPRALFPLYYVLSPILWLWRFSSGQIEAENTPAPLRRSHH
ncbi:MAG TPA: nucleotidyltransferase family protein [Pseudomonadales bacterium]|nr:nucleotidyltransferase family protein [Pseudomonadales bacterium]